MERGVGPLLRLAEDPEYAAVELSSGLEQEQSLDGPAGGLDQGPFTGSARSSSSEHLLGPFSGHSRCPQKSVLLTQSAFARRLEVSFPRL